MKALKLDQLSGLRLDNDIELAEHLGSGGMGVVYRAVQLSLGRDVCVKFMQSDLVTSYDWQVRFRREARALAEMHHKHLARIYSVGVYKGVYPYIVMELLNGKPLSRMLRERGTIDWRTAAELMIQLCNAMSFVHQSGFVHRDLKPDNIFVCEVEGKLCSKILDFGLVGRMESTGDTETVTGTRDLLGTILYMAPECFQKAQHQPSIDVYSLGCILYEMLTGTPPFDGDSPIKIAFKHTSEEVALLDVKIANTTERSYLDSLIASACNKKPEQRPSCRQLAESLRSALAGDFELNLNTGRPGSSSRLNFPSVIALIFFVFGIAFLGHRHQPLVPGLLPPGKRINLVQEELRKGQYVQADGHLRECLSTANLSAADRIKAQLMLVETSLYRRNTEQAVAQLIQSLELMSASPKTIFPDDFEQDLNITLRLGQQVFEKINTSSASAEKLKLAISKLLESPALSDEHVRAIVMLLESARFAPTPIQQRVSTSASNERTKGPGSEDVVDALIRFSERRPDMSRVYLPLAIRLTSQPTRYRDGRSLRRLAILFLRSNDLNNSLNCAHEAITSLPTARNQDGEYVINLILAAAYYHDQKDTSKTAACCQQAYALLKQKIDARSVSIPDLALVLSKLVEDSTKGYSQMALFPEIAYIAVPLAQLYKPDPGLVAIPVVQAAIQAGVASGKCTTATKLAKVQASLFRACGFQLEAAFMLLSGAKIVVTKDRQLARQLAVSALLDLAKMKEPESRAFETFKLATDVFEDCGDMAMLEEFWRRDLSVFESRHPLSLNYSMARILHHRNKDIEAADWLFKALVRNDASGIREDATTGLFEQLSVDDITTWVSKRRQLVQKDLRKAQARLQHSSSRPQKILRALSIIASRIPDEQLQKSFLLLWQTASTAPSAPQLISLAQCEFFLGEQKSPNLEPAIRQALRRMAETSPDLSIPQYLRYADIIGFHEPRKAVQILEEAAEVCNRNRLPSEEQVLQHLIFETVSYWSDIEGEVRQRPKLMQTINRLGDRKPRHMGIWSVALTWLVELNRRTNNPVLANRCAANLERVLKETSADALIYKAYICQMNGRFHEASHYYRTYLQKVRNTNSPTLAVEGAGLDALNLLHLAQYTQAKNLLLDIDRLIPRYSTQKQLTDTSRLKLQKYYKCRIAEIEYVTGKTSKAEQLWKDNEPIPPSYQLLSKSGLEEVHGARLMLYLLAGDKSSGDLLCRSIDTGMKEGIYSPEIKYLSEYYKLASKLQGVEPKKAAVAYRNYLQNLPVAPRPTTAPLQIRLACGLAEVLSGDLKAAEQTLGHLKNVMNPYCDWILEYDFYAIQLFLAIRKNDLAGADRIVSRLNETAGRVAPLLVRNMLRILPCCEQEARSDVLKKDIRKIIDRTQRPLKVEY
jgi:hypothetical protein